MLGITIIGLSLVLLLLSFVLCLINMAFMWHIHLTSMWLLVNQNNLLPAVDSGYITTFAREYKSVPSA